MSLHVGITGGIGAGKSTVCKIFQSLGIPVFDADKIAKSAYSDPKIKSQIEVQFGTDLFHENGLNTHALGNLVFSDSSKLKKLEAIIHPFVHQKWDEFEAAQSQAPYILRESALLVSSGNHANCDYIILVRAPKATRMMRVQKRSGLSQAEVEKRMSLQSTDEQSQPFCNFIIDNDETDSLIEQVMQIHHQLLHETSGIHK
jgi:dephospho-CoA kinase